MFKGVSLKYKDLEAVPFETVLTKDGYEYYYNAEHKLVARAADATTGYRTGELHPEVIKMLDKARKKYLYPTKAMIDTIITYQGEAIEKACKYVGYRLLGCNTYLDVYGQENGARWAAERHYQEQTQLYAAVKEMSKNLEDMQNIIINMALKENEEFKIVNLKKKLG